jgi:hypothetical protein
MHASSCWASPLALTCLLIASVKLCESSEKAAVTLRPWSFNRCRNCFASSPFSDAASWVNLFRGPVFGVHYSVTAVTVQISEGRNYARNVHSLKTIWDDKNKHLSSNDEKINLIAKSRSHKYFPFDSAPFDFELNLNPPRDFSTIIITNRVPGFLIDCGEIHSDRIKAGHFHIQFVLHRSPVVQLFASTFVLVAIAFLFLILWITQLTSLATSMASFFLALWSLRRILESQIKTILRTFF